GGAGEPGAGREAHDLGGQPLAEPGDGPGVGPDDRDPVDLVGGETGGLEGLVPGGPAGRDVLALAEPLLPQLGGGGAGGPPAVEELGGRAPPPEDVGDRVVADDERRGAVAAGRLVGRAGQPGA